VTRMIKDCLAFLLLINGGLFFYTKKCFVSALFPLLPLENNQLFPARRKINIFKVVVIVYVSFFVLSHHIHAKKSRERFKPEHFIIFSIICRKL
jgi:hypothetical protein